MGLLFSKPRYHYSYKTDIITFYTVILIYMCNDNTK